MASHMETLRRESSQTIHTVDIECGQYGRLRVHVQGVDDDNQTNVRIAKGKAVFLTVHDIGTNSSSFIDFVDSVWMSEIRQRSVFMHVDVLGQEDNAEDLSESLPFPSIQQIGEEMLPYVLDHFNVSLVVGIGEGAGANILVRFGAKHSHRVLGLVLIHLVSLTGVGFLDAIKDRFFGKRRQSAHVADLIAQIKLGPQNPSSGAQTSTSSSSTDTPTTPSSDVNTTATDASRLADNYRERVQTLNARNLQKFINSYINRKEISEKALSDLDIILVCGAKSPYASGVEHVYTKCSNKSKTSILRLQDTIDVLSEAPKQLSRSLLLFAKGLGFLTSLQLTSASSPTLQQQQQQSQQSAIGINKPRPNVTSLGSIGRRRTLSMEEYDLPRNFRRQSLSK